MPTPRQQAVALLNDYCGSEADDGWSAGSDTYYFTVKGFSLPGTVFAATGAHSLSVNAMTATEAWQQVLSDLRMGVEPCEVTDCEGCEA
jgi:hypothetical protein